MRHVRKAGGGLGVAVVLALAIVGATVASAAAALPELEYELPDTAVVSGGQIAMESATEGVHSAVKCTGTSGEVAMTGGRKLIGSVTFRLTGCTTKLFGVATVKCTSSGLAEGEVTTKSLAARLEYLSKANHEAGLIFNYGGKTSTVASFSCGGHATSVSGEFVAKVTPVNSFTNKLSLALKGAKGTPEYTQYENEHGESVALSPFEIGFEGKFEKSNLNATGLALEFSKNVVVKA